MADSENVQSIREFRPQGRAYQVSLTFSGDAATSMQELMNRLNTDDANQVVMRAIALLIAAQGKEILLKDLQTGTYERVEI